LLLKDNVGAIGPTPTGSYVRYFVFSYG